MIVLCTVLYLIALLPNKKCYLHKYTCILYSNFQASFMCNINTPSILCKSNILLSKRMPSCSPSCCQDTRLGSQRFGLACTPHSVPVTPWWFPPVYQRTCQCHFHPLTPPQSRCHPEGSSRGKGCHTSCPSCSCWWWRGMMGTAKIRWKTFYYAGLAWINSESIKKQVNYYHQIHQPYVIWKNMNILCKSQIGEDVFNVFLWGWENSVKRYTI